MPPKYKFRPRVYRLITLREASIFLLRRVTQGENAMGRENHTMATGAKQPKPLQKSPDGSMALLLPQSLQTAGRKRTSGRNDVRDVRSCAIHCAPLI